MSPNAEKLAAAEAAAGEVRSGMVVGLGSGSTAALAVQAIGRRVAAGLDSLSAEATQLSMPT